MNGECAVVTQLEITNKLNDLRRFAMTTSMRERARGERCVHC